MSINTKKYIEEYLKIKDKNSQIVNFKLNYPQLKLYNVIKKLKQEHKPVRIIILKARQMGFSTLTEAILFKETATKHNINSGIITHLEEATTNLFRMSKLYYSELPDAIKPQILNSNAKEIIFNNKENTGLNSKIRCMTAGSQGVGRSGTYNFLHLSELAFWQGDKKSTLNGLVQTVPNNKNSMIIIESTANGFDYYKELWDKAVSKENDYVPVFVGWNELIEYSMPYSGFKLTHEEERLQRVYNLSLDQLEWRRWCIRNNCQGDLNLFKQEYPICPEEAFIASGKCYFDKNKIIERIPMCPEPIKTGYFEYIYKNEKIIYYEWKDDSEGAIKIFEDVKKRYPYATGGDTAGEGSDYFTGFVINNITGKQIASLRQEYDETEYTRQMYCLGKYFNNALIGIEANYSTYPIKELERLGYDKQYVREKEDEYTNRLEKKLGFKTTPITRPLVLAQLQKIVLEEIDKIQDKAILQEMLSFIKNEKGRPEAIDGAHDDMVMGLAISYYVREQQLFTLLPKEIPEQKLIDYSEFGVKYDKKLSDDDFGSSIEII